MSPRLSPFAAELLILIGDHTEKDDGTGTFWVPPAGNKTSWSETLGRNLFIDGGGVSSALNSLKRKGLIRFHTICPYASSITEEGRVIVEHWRDTDTWPVERKS